MRSFPHSVLGRLLALVLCMLTGPLSCVPADLLEPAAGIVDRERPALVGVPGGVVNAAAGNLIVTRRGIEVDTLIGTWSIVATYNAASGRWTWSHRMHYDGQTFTDASGATHDVSMLADGDAVPGTRWTRVDAQTMRTRGGLTHEFGADGFLAAVRWATLAHPHVTVSATGMAQCTAPGICMPLFAIELDGGGRPAVLTELRSGREAQLFYDAAGRLVEARSASDVERGTSGTRYEYALGDTLLTAATTPEGERVEYRYQPGRRIDTVTQIGEGDPRHAFRYTGRTGDGHYRTSHENPLGGVTRYTFDEQRRLLRSEREGTGDFVIREWSGARATRVIAPGGVVTELVYADDTLVAQRTPAGNLVRYASAPGALRLDDPLGEPWVRLEDALGLVAEREHDASGRPVLERNGAGEEMSLEYLGSAIAGRTLAGVSTRYSGFGAHGHWRTAEIGGQVVSSRAHDPVGNRTVQGTESRPGGTLGRRFDAARRVALVERAASDADGHVTDASDIVLEWRSDGQLAAIRRPGGGDHEVAYDALGRPVEMRERVAGAWQTTTITYDAAGNQLARERDNGMREEFDYDAFGRMLAHRALRDGVLEGEEAFYWAEGRVVARYDSVRGLTEVYAYDAAGRLATTAFGHGETITRAYDPRDRLTAEVFSVPGVGVIADIGYGYDAAGRLVRVEDRATGDVLVEDRWVQGIPVDTTTGNGLVRSYQLDAQNLLAGAETRDALGDVVETTRIARSSRSAPPRFEISTLTTTPLATTEERYWLPQGMGLANVDQRVGKRLFGWENGVGGSRRYAWDALGNGADDAAGNAFAYDPTGTRLVEASLESGESVALTWDEAGFATSRNGTPLEWTATGRLARYGDDRLVWDLAGRLVESTVGGVTRRRLRFGGRVESDLTSVGWLDLGAVALHLGSGARLYRHLDFRGNVSFVSDDAGEVVAHHRYHPFGRDASWGPAAAGPAFEGQTSLGDLVLMGERVLDPLVGRFLSPDPVLNEVNQYAYALGNPVWFHDRDGREMTNRQAFELGVKLFGVALAVVAVSTGVGIVPATAIAVQAALRAGVITSFVVTVVSAVDSTLGALGSASPKERTGAPSPEPPKPGPPSPNPTVPAPQFKSLQLDVIEVRVCTPLGRQKSLNPWVLVLFGIAQLVAFGVWCRRGPGATS